MPDVTRPRRQRRPTISRAELESSPVYWFVRLQQAVDRGDFVTAQDAIAGLARLGIEVRWGRPPRRPCTPGGGGHVA